MIIHGDATQIPLADNCVDTCITDPPYELGFMGKHWDSSGVAFNPATWTEVYRVLKPGALLLSFGGTRTYHRMVCAVEDAGFEIRDTIGWVHGDGYTKSLNIGKATGLQEWDGWGTGLKPAMELIVIAQKPLDGTYAENALKWDVAGMWVDGARIAINKEKEPRDFMSEPRIKNPNYVIKASGHVFPGSISYYAKKTKERYEKGVRGSAHGIQFMNKNYIGYRDTCLRLGGIQYQRLETYWHADYNPFGLQRITHNQP